MIERKPRFVRYFVGGFALGAMCLVGAGAARADRAHPAPAVATTAR